MKKLGLLGLLLGSVLGLTVLVSACAGAVGNAGPAGPQGPVGPAGAPGAAAPLPAGDGLKSTITKVDIGADRKPVVTFTLKDAKDKPLKIADLDGYPSFILSYIKEDPTTKRTEYIAYTTTDVKGAEYKLDGKTVQPVLAEVKGRPATDVRAATPVFPADHPQFKDLGNGTFTYTFTTVLPADFDKSATTRAAAQITRAARSVVANPVLDFVPAGGAVKVTRQVVALESCNQCHDPLAVHGGSRRDTAYCVTCHTAQTIDPETGTTVDFKVMVHKIHSGNTLPSVVAGTRYLIVGNAQSVNDFGLVGYPQDVRNCTTCHGAPPVGMKAEDYAKLAPNADNWKNNPTRAACGACHDQIDWATGKSTIKGKNDHAAGPQTDDKNCKLCHAADSGKEFDASIVGAHVIPEQSKQLKGVKIAITSVTNTAPGQKPTVNFTAKDNAGASVPAAALTTVSFNVKGPTTDYLQPATTEAADLTKITGTDGNYTYNLATAIPADAKGTWAIAMEVRRLEKIVGNAGASVDVNGAAINPIFYMPVTDKVAVPRRQIVATDKCNVCHKSIGFHGGGRTNAEYCSFCHNPNNVDVPDQVPASFGGPFKVPAESITASLMIHRFHTGDELANDFTIYRTRGVFNFNEILFPGDRRDCAKCHVGTSNTLPLPATNAMVKAPREFFSPLGPAAAACLGCHDSKATAAHAATQTVNSVEACAACHGVGKEFDVAVVHKTP